MKQCPDWDKNVGKIIQNYRIIGIEKERAKDGHKRYIAECIYCGEKRTAIFSDFKQIKKDKCHHYTAFNTRVSIFNNKRIAAIWRSMGDRCYNINNKSYRIYGGKGIKICDEWLNRPLDFEMWALKNGYEDHLTIDRIDSSQSYCPENCRWLTMEDNIRHQSKTNFIDVDGVIKTGRQWAAYLGFGMNRINKYIREKGLEYAKDFIRSKTNQDKNV